MLKQTLILLCFLSLLNVCAVSASAAQGTFGDELLKGNEEELERRNLRQAEECFVRDNDLLLREYKKKYGGGNYLMEYLKDLSGESIRRGIQPTTAMKNCRIQYVVEMYTKKREKEHLLFYCMDGDKGKRSGSYQKVDGVWKPQEKKK